MTEEIFLTALKEQNKLLVEAIQHISEKNAPSWYQHPDLMWLIILGLIAVVLYFLREWHKSLYEAIREITATLKEVSNGFYELRGQHKIIVANLHKRKDDPQPEMQEGG